jgi:hypothetical protein
VARPKHDAALPDNVFKDWCAETTNPNGSARRHIVGDDTRRAYQHGGLLEKRRRLIDARAQYRAMRIASTADVVPPRAQV